MTRTGHRLFSLLAFSIALGSSCAPADPAPVAGGDGGVIVSEIAPVTPTGTLTGVVVDAFSGTPLSGVNVTVLAMAEGGGAVTDDEGLYTVLGVPASTQLAVEYAIESHFPARDVVAIPSSAGNLAQENGVAFSGPVGLLPKATEGGYLPDVIVRDDDAAPVGPVAVNVVLEAAWLVKGRAGGSLVATVTDAGGGVFELSGLPDFAALASVAPDASLRVVAVPDDAALRPTVRELSVQQAVSSGGVLVDLVAAGGDDGVPALDLAVVSSNVADLLEPVLLPSVLGMASDITVTFNTPVDVGSFFATAINSLGDPLPTSWDVDSATATITVSNARAGEDVYLLIEAFADGFAAGANGMVTSVRADGFYITASGADLKVRAYDATRNNNALVDATDRVTPRCLHDIGPKLILELDAPVGARRPNGQPLPVADLLPLRLVSTSAQTGHPLNEATDDAAVVGRIIDPPVGVRRSGFSSWVEVDWTALAFTSTPASPHTMQLSLLFNQVSLGAPNQAVVRRADGTPLSRSDNGSVGFTVALCF